MSAERNSISHVYTEVTRAALLGLVVNLLLGVVKLTGGIIGNSFALIADAVNSIGDVITTTVVLFASQLVSRYFVLVGMVLSMASKPVRPTETLC